MAWLALLVLGERKEIDEEQDTGRARDRGGHDRGSAGGRHGGYAAGDDGGTEVVAPPAEETSLPADEEAALSEVVEPESEPRRSNPRWLEPEVVEPEVVEPEVVEPDPEAEDPSPQPPIEVRPSGWVFEDCGTEYDGLLLLVTPGIVYSPEGPPVEFEGANYSEYLPDETRRRSW